MNGYCWFRAYLIRFKIYLGTLVTVVTGDYIGFKIYLGYTGYGGNGRNSGTIKRYMTFAATRARSWARRGQSI